MQQWRILHKKTKLTTVFQMQNKTGFRHDFFFSSLKNRGPFVGLDCCHLAFWSHIKDSFTFASASERIHMNDCIWSAKPTWMGAAGTTQVRLGLHLLKRSNRLLIADIPFTDTCFFTLLYYFVLLRVFCGPKWKLLEFPLLCAGNRQCSANQFHGKSWERIHSPAGS